jgi:predicted MarR family transcription regulator
MSNPVIIAELKRIASEHGGILNPADVVREARPPESPLHSKFEWNDTKAAEDYRVWQARQLIRVVVEYVGSGDQAVMSKVFVSLTSDREDGGYRPMVSVLADAGQRARLLADAVKEMESFEAKYKELQELVEVFDAMKSVRRRRRDPVATSA